MIRLLRLLVLCLGMATSSTPMLAAPVPATEPAAVALGIYRPAFPNDLSGLRTYESALNHPISLVHWYALWGGWKSAFSRADLDAVSAHGSLALITWEPWAGNGADPEWSLSNSVLSGKNDGYITSWANGMAAYGKPVLIRFAHEMHDQPGYPWAVGINGNTAADYLAAWHHVRDIFRRAHADNVRWVWNPNTLGRAPAMAYAAVYQALYPGDDEVDYLGLDIYNTGPQLDWGAPTWRTFSQALVEPYTAITTLSNKPLILPEVGSTEVGGSKAEWITDMLTTELAQFPRVRALAWFDVDKEQPWRIASSRSSLQAWKSATASGSFATDAALPT
jgi:beta-mannanase